MDYYVTLIERQANNLQQEARKVGADREHTPRILFGIDFNDRDRVTRGVLNGFACDPVLVGGGVNMHRENNTYKLIKLDRIPRSPLCLPV